MRATLPAYVAARDPIPFWEAGPVAQVVIPAHLAETVVLWEGDDGLAGAALAADHLP
jgi:hypothetical protein